MRRRCRGLRAAPCRDRARGEAAVGGVCARRGALRAGVPRGSRPHSLSFLFLRRSGGSSDNHYYRVPHHGHSRSDNNSCLKKLVRSLLGLAGWGEGAVGMGTGWGQRVPFQQ